MNIILDQITTRIISYVNSTSSSSIYMIFLHQNFTMFSSGHYSTSNGPTYSISNQFWIRSWITKYNSPTLRQHVAFFDSCSAFFYVNCEFVFTRKLVFAILNSRILFSIILVLFVVSINSVVSIVFITLIVFVSLVATTGFLCLISVVLSSLCSSGKRVTFWFIKSSNCKTFD